jgi:hypothetical protein
MKFLFSLSVCFFLSLVQIEAQVKPLVSLSPTLSSDVDANLVSIDSDLFLNHKNFGISYDNFLKLRKVLYNVADYAIANGTSDEGKLQALKFLQAFNAMLSGSFYKGGKIYIVNPDMALDLFKNRLNVINNAITALGKIDNSNNSKDIATTFINEFYKDKKSYESVFANELENPNNSSSEDSQINATLQPNQTETAKPAQSNTSNENNDIQNSPLPQY